MKTVIQLNEQGYYTGTATAFESPLEPGVFLIPAGCVDVEHPVIPENTLAKWQGDSWTFEPVLVPAESPTSATQPVPTEQQIAEQLQRQKRQAYQNESDPLFFKWQRGESTKEQWLEKVAEIDARFEA